MPLNHRVCEVVACPNIIELTEAGGSDLANLKTTARKTEDGRAYIVNGHKVIMRMKNFSTRAS